MTSSTQMTCSMWAGWTALRALRWNLQPVLPPRSWWGASRITEAGMARRKWTRKAGLSCVLGTPNRARLCH